MLVLDLIFQKRKQDVAIFDRILHRRRLHTVHLAIRLAKPSRPN